MNGIVSDSICQETFYLIRRNKPDPDTPRPRLAGQTITLKLCGYFQIVDGIIVDLINMKSLQANHSKPQASSKVELQQHSV